MASGLPCAHCRRPIERRVDLIVGKHASPRLLRPYHLAHLNDPAFRAPHRFLLPRHFGTEIASYWAVAVLAAATPLAVWFLVAAWDRPVPGWVLPTFLAVSVATVLLFSVQAWRLDALRRTAPA